MENTDTRKKLIMLLHVAKRDLCLDDDLYREMLQEATGKTSSAHMQVWELEQALACFKSKGFQVKGAPATSDPQIRKVWAMWKSMHEAGLIRNPSATALRAFCKRTTGMDALEWCSVYQKSLIIEELKAWQNRVMTKQK